MFMMAVGHTDDVDPEDAINAVIDECRAQLAGREPKAGLLFAGFESFEPSMPSAVRRAFPGIALVGSTSAAEMSSVGGYTEDGVTLAVFAADEVEITAGAGAHIDANLEKSAREAVRQALGGTSGPPRLAIILADALAAQQALDVMRDALPPDVVLVGGAASGANLVAPRPNFEFANDEVVENGVALLLFSGDLKFSVAVGTGLHPIGPTGVVTAADAGLIREIDGRPASAFIAPYVSTPGLATMGNPLAFSDPEGSDWYLRAMVGEDPDTGAITIPGFVPVGAKVQLTTASTDEIVDATSDVVRRATQTFPDDGEPAAALIFSCAVRKFMLGTRTQQEVAQARSLLPAHLPLAGMYCVGEIAPVAGDNESRFHNETFVALLLGA